MNAIGEQDHRQDTKDHGDLIGQELVDHAEAAEQGVLVVRAPGGDQDRHHMDGANGHDEQDADIQVLADQPRAKRQDSIDQEGWNRHQEWRQHMEEAVRVAGDNVLFGQHFDGVGDGLDRPIAWRAIRPGTVLHAADDLALHGREDEDRRDADDQQDHDADNVGNQIHPPLPFAFADVHVAVHEQR